MNKPVLKKNSFSVDDIHKLREYHYEKTKNLSTEERIKEISDSAKRVKKNIEKARKKKLQYKKKYSEIKNSVIDILFLY